MIQNPLQTYWKARKYFKFPKITIIRRKYVPVDDEDSPRNKYISLDMRDTEWKTKYGQSRFCENPYISLVILGKYETLITFSCPSPNDDEDDVYWESMIDYLYFDVPITDIMETKISRFTKEGPIDIPIKFFKKNDS